MILVEMVHDARIVRMNQEHLPPHIRKWMGDSVGRWEGDTLVVDTTNFNDQPGLRQADRNLHVVERFTRLDSGRLLYQFRWRIPRCGPRRGAASTCGRRARTACSSTPATRETTLWVT